MDVGDPSRQGLRDIRVEREPGGAGEHEGASASVHLDLQVGEEVGKSLDLVDDAARRHPLEQAAGIVADKRAGFWILQVLVRQVMKDTARERRLARLARSRDGHDGVRSNERLKVRCRVPRNEFSGHHSRDSSAFLQISNLTADL